MNSRNTVIRSLHDVGAAGWFGGSLMGAVALNGASKDVSDPAERAKIAASGWARWAPFAAAAIGAHLLGARLGTAGDVKAEGGTVPADTAPEDVARIQQRLRILQWATPVLTGVLVVLGAQQGEQQRPGQQAQGWLTGAVPGYR